ATMVELMNGTFSMTQLQAMKTAELIDYLQKLGRQRFKNPDKLAKVLKKSIRDSYRLGKVAQNSIDINLGVQMRVIRAFEKEIKVLDQAIKEIMETMIESKILLSIPGIGPVFAAGMMAEIGSIDRVDHEAQLAKYAGLTWPKHQYGSHQKEYTDYYNKKYNEVPKTQHKRALVLTARKFVRLVFALLSKHQLYIARSEAIES